MNNLEKYKGKRNALTQFSPHAEFLIFISQINKINVFKVFLDFKLQPFQLLV